MEFIETPIFTRLVLELLPDDEYRELQFLLADNPSCGVIRRVGGLEDSSITSIKGSPIIRREGGLEGLLLLLLKRVYPPRRR